MNQLDYLPRWRERLPSGELGPEYGPAPEKLPRQLARHGLWSWRPPGRQPKRPDARALAEFMCSPGATHVPARERQVYEAMYCRGAGAKRAAKQLGLTRETVRTYLRRLRLRAAEWASGAPPPHPRFSDGRRRR